MQAHHEPGIRGRTVSLFPVPDYGLPPKYESVLFVVGRYCEEPRLIGHGEVQQDLLLSCLTIG